VFPSEAITLVIELSSSILADDLGDKRAWPKAAKASPSPARAFQRAPLREALSVVA